MHSTLILRSRPRARTRSLAWYALAAFGLGASVSACTEPALRASGTSSGGQTLDPNLTATAPAPELNTGNSQAPNGTSQPLPPENTATSAGAGSEPGPGVDPDPQPPNGECKDGDKRSCEEDASGNPIEFPGGVPQGSCKAGTQTCQDAEWSACEGAVAPKAQDTCEPGNDDNCNGLVTDHCNCEAGSTQPCGSKIGICQQGVQTCLENGTWDKTCQGEIKPQPEICDGDGADEDCDGAADLADLECECISGEVRPCEVVGKRGDCSLGREVCASNGQWGTCRPRFRLEVEACGVMDAPDIGILGPRTGDEDCDGEVDESDASNQFFPRDPKNQGVVYMMDADGDGWGAIGTGSDVRRRYCNSRSSNVPEGFRPAKAGRENRDCGDCPESGRIINPDYDSFFQTVPNKCLEEVAWGPGPFDYNCDGRQEQEHTAVDLCKIKITGPSCEVVEQGFWDSWVPECGVSNFWKVPEDCGPAPGGDACILSHGGRRETQACR